jgi:hypothetical protein
MSVSVSQSKDIALTYIREHMDFGGNCICKPKAYSEEKSGRIVEVRYRETYLVMQLLVKDCGTVEVLRDRQQDITRITQKKFFSAGGPAIDLQALHDNNVENTITALQMIREEFPDWFVTVDRDPENGKKGDPEISLLLKGKKKKTVVVRVKMARTKAIRARYNHRINDQSRLRTITLLAGEVRSPDLFKSELLRRLRILRADHKL